MRSARCYTYLARVLPLTEQHFHVSTNVPSDKYEIGLSLHLRGQRLIPCIPLSEHAYTGRLRARTSKKSIVEGQRQRQEFEHHQDPDEMPRVKKDKAALS
jgi:hypothetical protein